MCYFFFFFFFQAEDGIRDLVRSRGLGDVYKRQVSTQSTGPTGCTAKRDTPTGRNRDRPKGRKRKHFLIFDIVDLEGRCGRWSGDHCLDLKDTPAAFTGCLCILLHRKM
eukprot:TRINITY_DN116_c0_g1_i4.p1 TRINITY_DN116_c0_g1~~TRINITY_DN116_c0_g1_i4.p1  ORF type:complete len:109 (-),score=19.21 TRINITY_DN116_c0_g1_i4:246-572(-)